MHIAFRIIPLILLASVLGCGGSSSAGGSDAAVDGGTGSCAAYVVPGGTDLTTPTISFSTDIMKLFNNNCDLASCHGSTTVPSGGLFLGLESAMRSDAAQVYAGLVGHASSDLTSMAFITSGDPTKSYMMHKLDGDQCQYDRQCVSGSCGELMPAGDENPLPVATRDTLRRWIAQGALDN